MSETLNVDQQELADTLDGFIVEDAGPGTGKTTTIVNRYINILKNRDVGVDDILMLSFTDNAAESLRSKVSAKMRAPSDNGEVDPRMFKDSKNVKVRTFDSFCRSVVVEGAESVGDFFGFDARLNRSAILCTNESLKQRQFSHFYNRFMDDHGEDYGDVGIVLADSPKDVLGIIEKLMSRGLIPVRGGWFGFDAMHTLEGDSEALAELQRINIADVKKGFKDLSKKAGIIMPLYDMGRNPPEEVLQSAVDDDRSILFRFIHDVYYEYIRRSILDNRLTFSLFAMFALVVLYSDKGVRDRNSFKYLIIDEFQDTNANQMMIAMMVLTEWNLCVVGDWKQGIYGFRNVSIENITRFEERLESLRSFLNDGEVRVPYQIADVRKLSLKQNYRSTDLVIQHSFKALTVADSKKRKGHVGYDIVELGASGPSANGQTDVRYVVADTADLEVKEVVKAVCDYMSNGYELLESTGPRPMRYSDIAVLCPKRRQCRQVMDVLRDNDIPCFMQGDVEIMSTREGKLALAWLKFVNNSQDAEGSIPILVDLGYSLADIGCKGSVRMPESILEQRRVLMGKKRRVCEMLSCIFSFYDDMDPDVIQAIITAVSSEHRGGLLTISDVIDMIENDIANDRTYTLEPQAAKDAVTIMTMHKSKGLEFGAVIIPFVDKRSVPMSTRSDSKFAFDPVYGLRMMETVYHHEDGTDVIASSWKTKAVKSAVPPDYDEDRRLLFVAMSRAKQFLTLIAMKGSESNFFLGIRDKTGSIPDGSIPPVESADGPMIPAIGEYTPRRRTLGVHDIMDVRFGKGSDEICGKGPEYGTMIHEDARLMQLGRAPKVARPEHAEIRRVLDGVKDADLVFSEVECILPVEGTDVSLKGVIDLVAVYPDRVEIHDYKTDAMRTPEVERVHASAVGVRICRDGALREGEGRLCAGLCVAEG